jgi:hypothetical protein
MKRRQFVTSAVTLAFGGIASRGGAAHQVASGTCAPAVEKQDSDLIYFDSYGLPVQRNCDGGDTAQRVGWMWLGIHLRTVLGNPWHISPPITFEQALQVLEPQQDGMFIRHPVTWNDPKDFSRDQTIPLIAAMGLSNSTARLTRTWNGVVRL